MINEPRSHSSLHNGIEREVYSSTGLGILPQLDPGTVRGY